MEILAASIRSPEQVARLYPETRVATLGALEENEPGFPGYFVRRAKAQFLIPASNARVSKVYSAR